MVPPIFRAPPRVTISSQQGVCHLTALSRWWVLHAYICTTDILVTVLIHNISKLVNCLNLVYALDLQDGS